MKHKITLLQSAVILFFFLASTVFTATITVNPGAGTPLQDAIDLAIAGDVIHVAAGTYPENILINKQLTLNGANVGIAGNGIRNSESIISPVSGTPIIVTADGVTINGFEITGANSNYAIVCGNTSNLEIVFNNIHSIGSALSSGNVHSINYSVANGVTTSNVVISDNKFTSISSSILSGASASAIGILQSTSTGVLNGLDIERNVINGVNVNTGAWPTGKIAYGIQINVGSGAGGKVISARINENKISNLEGFISTAIALEGNTENAVVDGNEVSNLTGYKTANRSGGGYDLSALKFEQNNFVETCTVTDNLFRTNTFVHDGTPNRGYAVSNYVVGSTVNVDSNWFGASDPFIVADNANLDGKIFNKESCETDFLPIATSADLPLIYNGTGPIVSDNGDTYLTIEDAINDAQPGDEITVPAGTYPALGITANGVTLIGNGAVISNGSPAITVNANNVTITGFTFNFDAVDYAIDVQAGAYDVTISDCNFNNLNGGVGNGVINRGTGVVNAIENYWNSPLGPTVATNPSGVGTIVSNTSTGSLLYYPWWTDQAHTTLVTLPTLNTPVNGLTGLSIEPTLSWIDSFIDETGFTVEISLVGSTHTLFDGDANVITFTTAADVTSKEFNELMTDLPLDNNQKYYWRVTVNGGTFDGAKSAIYHFTTVPEVTVYQTLPNNTETINYTDVTFYWYIIGSQGSMQFKIQVKESATSPTATEWATVGANDFVTTTANTNQLFNLLQGKKYYWRVIVLNASNEVINYSSTQSFNTSGGITASAIQTWPVGGATLLTNTPTLYWYLDSYAPGVTFQVKYNASNGTIGGLADPLELDAGDKYPTDLNMVANGSTNLFLTLPILSSGTTYYWQVRVYYPTTGLYGPWSSVASFITNGSGTLVKPIASYPTGNVTIYTTAPTLYWYTGTSGLGLTYNIDIELVSAGLDGIANYSGISDLYKLLTTTLTPGESYVWSVQSDNGIGQSLWSDPATFTVTGGVGNGYPVITWPIGNPTMYTTKPTINWFIEGSQLGLTNVILRYKEGSNSTDWNTTYDGSFTIPITSNFYTFLTDLTEGSTYYFALASTDGSTLSAWDEDAFTIYNSFTNLSDPNLTSPIGGIELGTKSPTLYWFVIGDQTLIQSFEVTYSSSDVFAGGSPTTEIVTTTNSSLALSNLTPGATYYWKVRSLYTNSNYSNYSATETFVINPGSNAVQPIVGGPHNVIINTTSPTISWVLPTAHSATLNSEIVIADNPDMIDAITVENISDSRFNASNLEIGKSYFWKVRTRSSENIYSEYSGQGVFKIGDNVTDVEEPIIVPERFEVSQNYPNPFNPSTVISYSIPNAEFVSIRVYNMLGQEIATLLNEEVNAGTYNVTWNGMNNSGVKVATGTYIYRVSAGSNIVTKKMLLIK